MRDLREWPVVTVEQVHRFREAALKAIEYQRESLQDHIDTNIELRTKLFELEKKYAELSKRIAAGGEQTPTNQSTG